MIAGRFVLANYTLKTRHPHHFLIILQWDTRGDSCEILTLLRRVLRASLQRDPGVEGADQSRSYANAGLVQCFRRSSVVGRGNVLVSRHLLPKSIADTLSITLFISIGDNSIDIKKYRR